MPTTTLSQISTVSEQVATATRNSRTIGGIFGAIIVILTLLLVLSLVGLLYMYRKVKITEEDKTIRERTLSR